MKKILSIFFIALLYNTATFAQNSVTLKIIDSSSKKPIPFVVVKTSSGHIRYTDENGTLLLDQSIDTEYITLSCISYVEKKIPITQKNDKVLTVALSKMNIALKEVFITPSTEIKTIPFIKKRRDYMFGISDAAVELALRLPFKAEDTYLSKRLLSVKIKAKKISPHYGLRLHIYEVDSVGQPGIELLSENIICNTRKGELTADLSNYNIIVSDNDIFIGVECTGPIGDNTKKPPKLGISHASKIARTYTRTLNHRDWVLLNFPIEDYGTPPNIMVSVTYK